MFDTSTSIATLEAERFISCSSFSGITNYYFGFSSIFGGVLGF